MKTLLVLATSLIAIPCFAAGKTATTSFKFAGDTLSASVQKKIASSANRAIKRDLAGPLENATITIGRGTAITAALTGTQTIGGNADQVTANASFKISTSAKGNVSVVGLHSRSRAYVGQEVTSPTWSFTQE